MRNNYENRMARVIDYIHDNLAGDLSLDVLADVAAMSRFHWHRVFHALTGETMAQATRRIRLFRASNMLIETDLPMAKISAACGYPNIQSFTRAFRAVLGLTPTEFRKRGVRPVGGPDHSNRNDDMFDVTIKTTPEIRLAALPHTGPYIEIGAGFEKIVGIVAARGIGDQVGPLTGVYYHDPSCTPSKDLKSLAGVQVSQDFEIIDPLEEFIIPSGASAVLLHRGHYAQLHKAYTYLYAHWLPNSGREARDVPPYEVYLNSPQDTAPDDLQTQIVIPLV